MLDRGLEGSQRGCDQHCKHNSSSTGGANGPEVDPEHQQRGYFNSAGGTNGSEIVPEHQQCNSWSSAGGANGANVVPESQRGDSDNSNRWKGEGARTDQ